MKKAAFCVTWKSVHRAWGGRRAETDCVLPYHRCMRVSAVRPHSQKRQADTDAGDVYVGVGWEPKGPSHTPVPEGPYQIEMLADKELRES
jgi:hypothetical protein